MLHRYISNTNYAYNSAPEGIYFIVMSSLQERTANFIVEEPATNTNMAPSSPTRASKWVAILRSPLWLCLLAALILRIWLVYHTHGTIDGDEALVGIQAEHILRGEHPIYYYAQPYMGSLEAYLIALIFAIVGPSVWALRTEPILLSLLIVWLTWLLADALATAAHLAPFPKQLFKTIAALGAAIPPLYDTVLEIHTNGGYIETFVLMLLMLLSAFHLTRRWHEGASTKELALRWAIIGFLVGLGIWVYPLISVIVLTVAIWILLFCLSEMLYLRKRASSEKQNAPSSFIAKLLLVVAAIPTCILGMAPALRWGYTHQWANFTYILQLGNTQSINIQLRPRYHGHIALIRDQTYLYTHYVAPRVIGGTLPKESGLLVPFHSFTLAIGLACIALTLILVALALAWHSHTLLQIRQLSALPLLFAFVSALLFCTSLSTSVGLISFQNDLAGRYATPLMLVLPFFFATVFTLPTLLHRTKTSLIENKQAELSETTVTSPSPPQRRIQWLAQGLVLFVLLAYFGAQISTYALTDPDYTFLSPSCPTAPANDAPIIAYLQQQHVHYAWAMTWIANPIIFKTNNSITLADPRFIIYQDRQMPQGRIPSDTEALLHADRPALLTLVQHTDTYPVLLHILDSQGITYHTMRFYSAPGYDVLVVTSLSRTLSLGTSNTFKAAFHACI